MIVLKVTGLGFLRAEKRTIIQKLLMYSMLTIGSTAASIKLFEKSEQIKTKEGSGDFDPIQGYLKVFY